MPLPTPPSKLGNLLSPDEYKARARPAKSTKKLPGDGDAVESESFGSRFESSWAHHVYQRLAAMYAFH